MRLLTVGLFIACLAQPVRADDSAAVKVLLDKAVKAQGGAEKAAKLNDMTVKIKGQINEGGMMAEMALDLSLKDFDRLRGEMTMTVGGMVNKATVVIAGDKGWARDSTRDKVEEAPKETVPMVLSVVLAIRGPLNPVALAGRKDMTLAHGGEAKVDDTPAEVLRIGRKDRPDVIVYFDKKTGLPLKSETQITEPGGMEKNVVFLFSDFKDVDGAKMPGKIKVTTGDAKETIELELSDLKAGVKFEANTFEKP